MKKIFLAVSVLVIALLISACDAGTEINTFELLNRRDDQNLVSYVSEDQWRGSLPKVHEGESLSLGAYIVNNNGETIELDSDGSQNGLTVSLYDEDSNGVVELDNHGDHVHVIGTSAGTTKIVFNWTIDGEVHYTTPPIDVVVEEGHDHDTEEIDTFEILNRRDDENKVAYVHGDHWHGSLPEIHEGESLSLGAYIVSEDGRERELDSDGEHNGLEVSLYEGAPEDIVSFALHGDHVHIIAENPGITQIVFHWTHHGEVRYTTPPIDVIVTD